MFRKVLIFTLSLLLFPLLAPAADLTGTWRSDDGGTYYLREMNNTLHWYGEESATNPRWANVFQGRIRGRQVRGTWMDVPKGRTRGHGQLVLAVRPNGMSMDVVRKTGGFGSSHWTRVVHRRSASAPVQPMRREMHEERPRRQAMAREDCIGFNPNRVSMQQVNGRWKIVEGSHWLFDFDHKRGEAETAYRVIRAYKMNQSCFVGRPNPSFSYMLSNGRAPAGRMAREDCISFNPNRIDVQRVKGSWKVVEGNHWLFDFGNNRREAEQTASIIRKYGFTHSCFVGRPDPSFSYMRR